MKNPFSTILSISLAIFLLTGCNSSSSTKSPVSIDTKIDIKESTLERNLNPNADLNQTKELATHNNHFAFDMFKELQKNETDNIFFSPYSISEALVMTYAGAKEETKTQMVSALHFDANDSKLHNTFNALDLHLNHSDENYTLSVANALWPQKDFTFLETYLDALKVNYGAKIRLMDYVGDTEGSRKIINEWVEEKTHERIKNLIPAGQLDPATRLVLTNAIYFKGKWKEEFNEFRTKEESFTLLDNSTIQTQLMSQTSYFSYSQEDTYQSIDLPYIGDKTSMVIILPNEGKFQEVLEDINTTFSDSLLNMERKNISLKLPKFEFTTGLYHLNEPFISLGVSDAFDSNLADFSNMTGTKNLFISKILHKAFIKVDENGSEAAAATAVVVELTSAPMVEDEMFINRPFIFFIKDQMSNQILFMGLIKEPKL